MDKAYFTMKMEAFIKVAGSKTKCMEKVVYIMHLVS